MLLLGGLVVATAAIAAWVGAVAGNAIATVLSALFVPLLLVGFIAGFDRRSVKILFGSVVAAGFLGLMLRAITSGPPMPTPPTVIAIPGDPSPQAGTGIVLGVLVVVLLASVVAVMLLAHAVASPLAHARRRGGRGAGHRPWRRGRRPAPRPPVPPDASPPRPVDAVGA